MTIYKKYKGIYTDNSIRTRYNSGRRIFDAGLQEEALRIVKNSKANI